MGQENGGNGDEAPFSGPTAQILTKAVIPSLGKGLDASDVIECYALMRVAKLRPVPSRAGVGAGSGASGVDGRRQRGSHRNTRFSHSHRGEGGTLEAATNTTGSSPSSAGSGRRVTVRKMALAFRYKPQAGKSSGDPNDRGPFELTLEYGPQRAGASMNSEAMPVVNNAGGHGAEGDVGVDDYEEGKYMSWENEAKIYYETSLAAEQWTDAYYMAPITGAVLSNLLETAVEYPSLQPRYQPFEVVAHDTGKVVFRSSSSEDFVWAMFEQLAKLHVVMDPILTPPRHSIRLHVATVTDLNKYTSGHVHKENDPDADIPGTPVAELAAEFYENLYTCANAIRTGDYSIFETPTDAPSASPTLFPTIPPSTSPAIEVDVAEDGEQGEDQVKGEDEHEDGDEQGNDEQDGGGQDGSEHGDEQDDQSESDDGNDSAEDATEGESKSETSDGEDEHQDRDEGESEEPGGDGGRLLHALRSDTAKDKRVLGKKNKSQESELVETDAPSPDSTGIPTLSPSQPPSLGDEGAKEEAVDKAEAAAAAAEAAAQAAQEAKQAASSPEDSAAADAAEAAAHAAKKAAEATSSAAAQASMDDLLSGDGKLMTAVLSTCFSDRKYGIRKERSEIIDNSGAEGEFAVAYGTVVTTYAYLFLDGANYYRLNLTAPYLDTAVRTAKIPKPQTTTEGHGEFIDWFLALTIIGLLIVGVVVLMGHLGLLTVNRCLRLRWFFKPNHSDGRGRHKRVMDSWDDEEEEDDDDDDDTDLVLKFGNSGGPDRRGEGFPHTFGVDAIPPSMSGRVADMGRTVDRVVGGLGSLGGMGHPSPSGYRDNPQLDAGDNLGDVELMPPSSSNPPDRRNGYNNGSNSFRSSRSSMDEDLAFDFGGGMDDRIGTMKSVLENGNELREKTSSPSTRMMLPVPGEHRMNRDPDLVDLPNLKSKSKPAVPVSMVEGRA